MVAFQQMIEAFFQGVHFDEHSLLMYCMGTIFGMIIGVSVSRGYHHRIYGAYRNYRHRYD